MWILVLILVKRDVQTNFTSTTTNGHRRSELYIIIPRDQYTNNFGPGRRDAISVTGIQGTIITGSITDNGDGSYTIPVDWDTIIWPTCRCDNHTAGKATCCSTTRTKKQLRKMEIIGVAPLDPRARFAFAAAAEIGLLYMQYLV